jgi:hypothetical protein
VELHIDVRWLLERQEDILPKAPDVHDYTALVAAVARHRVNTPRVGATTDPAWRAAVLMHTLIRLRPLPARNLLFGAAVAVAYLHACGEPTTPGHNEVVDLARDIDHGLDVYDTAARIRNWHT